MTILRNALAVVLGFVVGSAVNMTILIVGMMLIPAPAGVDVMKPESIGANIHLFEPKHFATPFLAHAVGTLAGCVIAFVLAGNHRSIFAWVIGILFLAAGIANCFMIPAPFWYDVVDVVGAYLPMAWLATLIGSRITGNTSATKVIP